MWKSTENVNKFYPPEVVSQNEEGAVKSHLCAWVALLATAVLESLHIYSFGAY